MDGGRTTLGPGRRAAARTLTALCEHNYALLAGMLRRRPPLDNGRLVIERVSDAPHTSVFALRYLAQDRGGAPLATLLNLRVRACHDARVAEVLAPRSKARGQLRRKWLLNTFLHNTLLLWHVRCAGRTPRADQPAKLK